MALRGIPFFTMSFYATAYLGKRVLRAHASSPVPSYCNLSSSTGISMYFLCRLCDLWQGQSLLGHWLPETHCRWSLRPSANRWDALFRFSKRRSSICDAREFPAPALGHTSWGQAGQTQDHFLLVRYISVIYICLWFSHIFSTHLWFCWFHCWWLVRSFASLLSCEFAKFVRTFTSSMQAPCTISMARHHSPMIGLASCKLKRATVRNEQLQHYAAWFAIHCVAFSLSCVVRNGQVSHLSLQSLLFLHFDSVLAQSLHIMSHGNTLDAWPHSFWHGVFR